MRIDLHLHTRASFDSLSDPERVLDAALARGLDRIAITDHNTIEAAVAMKARFPDRIIVGEEVKTAERVDIIGLYLNEPIPKGTPARETCTRIRSQGGLVYVPHPFARGKGGGGSILPLIEDLVDAVEGFNARLHDPALNAQAVQWAAARGLPLGAGSDAHTLGEVGRAHVELAAFEDTAAGLLAALRAGRLHGEASPRSVHLHSTLAKLRKRAGLGT